MRKVPIIVAFCAMASVSLGEAAQVRLQLEKVFKNEDRKRYMVTTLVPLGGKGMLVGGNHSRSRLEREPTEEEMEEARKTGYLPIKVETLEKGCYLARLNERGKVVGLSPMLSDCYVGLGAVAMEQEPTCPYALLNRDQRRLHCFDYSLNPAHTVQLPLHEIQAARPTVEGKKTVLWLFGRQFERAPEGGGYVGTLSALRKRPVQTPQSLGVRLSLPDKSVAPLPVSVGEVVQALEGVAKDPQGKKLKLQPASVEIVPFSDWDEGAGGFWVLLSAVAAKEYRNAAAFAGIRCFFRASMTPEGLTSVSQVPLWVVQEAGREAIDLEEKDHGAEIKVPPVAQMPKVAIQSLSGQQFLLFLEMAVQTEKEWESETRPWQAFVVLAWFSGSSLRYFGPLKSPALWVWGEKFKKTGHPEVRTSVYGFLGFVGKQRLIFRGDCFEEELPQECLAVYSVDLAETEQKPASVVNP